MPETTISVIVPCYNCKTTIDRCISSLLSSKEVSLQIILADDGSTDGTGEICKNFASSYPQIVYLALPHKGVSAARNAGLKVAAGEYIGFTDSDDYVDPEMFSTLLAGICSGENILSVCGFFLEFQNSKVENCYKEYHSVSYNDFLINLFIDPKTEGFLFNKLFSANLLKDHSFDESLSVCEDLYFLTGLPANDNDKVSYCPKTLYHYVQSDNSLTGGRSFFKDNLFRYMPAFKKLKETVKNESLQKAVGRKYYNIIRHSMSVIMSISDNHPVHTAEDIKELKLLQKELRHSKKNRFFPGFSFKEKFSYLKTAYFPVSFLLRSYDKKHKR